MESDSGASLRRDAESALPVGARGFCSHLGFSLAALALIVLFGGGCSREAASGGNALVVTGSSTLAPVVAELARQYEHERPGIRIDVQSGGSSRGILDVRSGLAGIGMVSRALNDGESDLRPYPIARDGVAIILNAQNPIESLSDDTIRALYRGEFRRWTELGGDDTPVVLVHKAEGRATRTVFLEYFGLDGRSVHADVMVGENEQAIKTVAGSPGAIGYVSIGAAAIDLDHGVPIKLVTIGGVPPTLENLRQGRYPIARPLNLITQQPATGLAREFIDYVRSPAAEALIEAQTFVQVGP